MLITWDNVAVAPAVVAVSFRIADRPRAATLASSIAVLATTIAGWVSRPAAAGGGAIAGSSARPAGDLGPSADPA